MLKTLTIIFAVSGAILFLYSETIPAFENAAEFDKQVIQMLENGTEEGRYASDSLYYKLRDKHITSKYKIQDYATVLLVVAALLLSLRIWGVYNFSDLRKLKIPSSIWVICGMGAVAAVVTTISLWYSNGLDWDRGIEPPWIGPSGPVNFFILVAGFFLATISLVIPSLIKYRRLQGSMTIWGILDKQFTPSLGWWLFLGAPTLFCLGSLLWCAIIGVWEGIVPSALWFVFFLLLLAGWPTLWVGSRVISTYRIGGVPIR